MLRLGDDMMVTVGCHRFGKEVFHPRIHPLIGIHANHFRFYDLRFVVAEMMLNGNF